MNRIRRSLLFVLLLLSLLPADAGVATGRKLVASSMQLANNAVLAMYQDEMGNMWVGTYDGLHLYDGKETFVYRMELDNDLSLSSNIILRIVPAESGFLWVATSLGVNKFSLDERRVTESYMMEAVEADNIVSDGEGNTLLFSGDGFVACYRPGGGTFVEIPMSGVRRADVVAVWAESVGSFAMLARDGMLTRYRMELTGAVHLVQESAERISETSVRKASWSGGELCFVDDAGLLWRYDCRKGRAVYLSDLSTLGERGLTASAVRSFDSYVYVGFFGGGLGRVPRAGGPCEMIAPDYRVFCLWPDRYQDILWVGTDGYGAFMYCDKQASFTTLLMSDLPEKVFNPVRALHTDHEGSLWIGTKGGGVIRIRDYAACGAMGRPLRDFAAAITRFDTRNGLSSNEVFAFCPGVGRDLLWIGSSGPGISCYDYRDGRIRTLHAPEGMSEIRHVHEICQTDSSTLFVASDTEALIELTLGSEDRPVIRSMRRYRFRMGSRDCNGFYAMIRESDSTLLLGLRGGYGLIRFNIRTKDYDFVDMQRLQRRALGDLLSLCRSRSSGLYCGTSSGLIHLTPGGDIRQFDRRNGIANDMVHGVLEDAYGCIWLSTNKGLTQYNPRTDFFHNYAAADLDVTEFCDDAYWKCPYTGRLFFGGVNGVVWIDPLSEPQADYRPPLQFIGVEFPDGTSLPIPRRDTLSDLPPVRIGPGIAGFTVSFVAVDYLNGENFEYSYRLGGDESSWIELQKTNRVTFTDPAPGTYRLDVRYKSHVLDAADAVYSLPIVVLPPWYGTTVARVIYLLLAAGCVMLVIAAVRRHYKRQQQQIVRRVEEEAREKLTEARVNFFVNISHELCTPLTLINGMNERIAGAIHDPELLKYTEVMRENVRSLNDLIQEILDFRKIEEAGFGRVRILPVDIGGLLSPQVRSFADAAARNGIELLLEVSPGLVWNTDVSFLKKIVLNLLSNAMKYTPRDGRIRITAVVEDDTFLLRVWNSGRGIEPARLAHVFDRYRILDSMDRNMYTDSASRNGLGLFICHGLVQALEGEISVRSEVGSFTEFSVRLPYREPAEEPVAVEETASATEPVAGLTAVRRDDKASVLVVDDNRDILWLIESALSADYRVRSCCSVDEALSALGEMIPDLIVTDIVMAGHDGLDLIARVRGDRFLRSVPIIVVSAKVTEGEQIEGLEAGADAYLTKPFSVQVLGATVARLISSRRMLKEYYNAPESAYTVVEELAMHRTDKEFMDAVVGAVCEHLEREDLRIELIAEQLGFTPRAFSRKFKKVSGRTPSEFIKEVRFEQAARLLKTTTLTVQEVMYRVGISNKSYFYREFQLKYGVKPKEYRQQP